MSDPVNLNPAKAAACAFFTRLLTPIARILLRHGVSFREMAELSKRVYVAVATDEYGVDGRPTNVSRVALLTGLTRRDVRKVRLDLNAREQQVIGRMNMAARVLSGWFQDPDFCDAEGRPLALAESGDFPSFSQLARRYAVDVPVTATLKELKKAGAVAADSSGMLIAKTRYYMPGSANPAAPQAITRSSSVLADIGNTIEYNLRREAGDPTRFERRVTNIRISPATVPSFRSFMEQEGQAFLERVDDWLTRNEVEESSVSATLRLGLGMYWIEDSTPQGVEK